MTEPETCCSHLLCEGCEKLAQARRRQVAAVRRLLEHAKNVSPSQSMTVYVTDVEAALEVER